MKAGRTASKVCFWASSLCLESKYEKSSLFGKIQSSQPKLIRDFFGLILAPFPWAKCRIFFLFLTGCLLTKNWASLSELWKLFIRIAIVNLMLWPKTYSCTSPAFYLTRSMRLRLQVTFLFSPTSQYYILLDAKIIFISYFDTRKLRSLSFFEKNVCMLGFDFLTF